MALSIPSKIIRAEDEVGRWTGRGRSGQACRGDFTSMSELSEFRRAFLCVDPDQEFAMQHMVQRSLHSRELGPAAAHATEAESE